MAAKNLIVTNYFTVVLENLAYLGKFLSCSQFIVSLLILGYLGCDRKKFAKVIASTLFAVILASFLKSVFKHPLPMSVLHNGWSFPSGHLTVSIVLWLSIAWEYRSKLFLFLAIVINLIVSFALLFFNYHFLNDLLASTGFAIIWLAIFYLTLKNWPNHKDYEVYLLFAIIGLVLNYFNETPEAWSYHLWAADASLFGFSLGWGIVSANKINNNKSKSFKAARALIGLLGFGLIYYIFNNLDIIITDSSTAFFEFFLLSLWISLFTEQISKPLNKIFLDERKKNH